MKNLVLILCTMSLSLLSASAQQVEITQQGARIKAQETSFTTEVTFYTPEIVRVTKIPNNSTYIAEKGLSVIIEPEVKIHIKSSQNSHSLILKSNSLQISINKLNGNICFSDLQGKTLLKEKDATFTPRKSGSDKDAYIVKQAYLLDKEEAIYGLGIMQTGKLNLRGEKIKMLQSNLEDYAHVMQSIKGYGLFWDNYSPTDFTDTETETSFTSEVGDCINYYFLWGKNADSVIAELRQLTGDVPMMPLWSYGFWQSRERYKSQEETVGVVRKHRELGVPLDGIIQDWQYWGSNYLWNSMEFLNDEFPNPQRMIKEIKDLNAHTMISIWSSFGPETKPYRELNAKGHLLEDVETWPRSGVGFWPPRMDYPSGVRIYDAYSSEARDIYWKYLKNLYDMGIDTWWMDSTDPDHHEIKDKDYESATALGSWRSVRNAYPLMAVSGVYDHIRQQPNAKRVFILTRSYFAGQQRYASNVWSGDIGSSWEDFRKQIPAGLNYTLTGAPHFNTDIGGFFANRYNKHSNDGSATRNPRYQELYVRWLQYGIYSPMMRSHGTEIKREIYYFGKPGETIYDAIHSGIKQRYALIPYIYSTSWDVSKNRKSFLRALFMDFPNDKQTWDCKDQFLFGKSLLIAPILHPQYTDEKSTYSEDKVDFTLPKTEQVYLPKGTKWYDIWKNTCHEGGQILSIQTFIDKAPVYVRQGSILPVGPDVQWVTQKTWDNLEIRIYPGADATFTLYEDDGESYDYEEGKYSTIKFQWNDKAKRLTIHTRVGEFEGMINQRIFKIVIVDENTPAFGVPATNVKEITYTGKKINLKW